MSILNRIEELRNSGLNDKKVRAYLVLEDFSAKDITEAFKSLGGAKKAKGFAAEYYEWLAANPRTTEEATQYIKGTGEFGETSDNVKKHLSHYLNIHSLASTIWESKVEAAPEAEADAETSEREDAIKAAWDKLKKARAGKRKVKTIHPDKVSYLNDEELTTAYSDYFKNAA